MKGQSYESKAINDIYAEKLANVLSEGVRSIFPSYSLSASYPKNDWMFFLFQFFLGVKYNLYICHSLFYYISERFWFTQRYTHLFKLTQNILNYL